VCSGQSHAVAVVVAVGTG